MRRFLRRLVSDRLAQALRQARRDEQPRPAFRWHSQPLGARIALEDKDAVRTLLDRDEDSDTFANRP